MSSLNNIGMTTPNSNSASAGAHVVKPSLWAHAFAELSEKDRLLFGGQPSSTPDTAPQSMSDVLTGILASLEAHRDQCQRNRRKTRSILAQEVVVRDVCERFVSSVSRFMSVVDVVVSFDPVHAALPWAAIRLLLQLCTNSFKAFEAVVEGLEKAAGIIARCTIMELMYLLSPGETASMELRTGLEESLRKLYAAVIGFLCQAMKYFRSEHLLKLFNLLQKQSLDEKVQAIKDAEDEFLVQKNFVDGERIKIIQDRAAETSSALANVDKGIQSVHADQDKLQNALAHLQQPFVRAVDQISELYDAMKASERADLLKWLSTVPTERHYRAVLTDLMNGSGQWLLCDSEFTGWRDSSLCETFWLCGPPGYGKSKLAAAVIQHLRDRGAQVDNPAPVAHFFCSRDSQEMERSDAGEILRSLVKQMSLIKDEERVRRPAVSEYERKEAAAKYCGETLEALTTQECVSLLIKLGETTPATIVIDALDECSSPQRGILLSAFTEIQERCQDVVKIFVSSRFTQDIAAYFRKGIEVTEETTRTDLSEFVKDGVDRVIKKWVSVHPEADRKLDKLRTTISSTLEKGAQGMFLWVSLQLDNISDFDSIKTPDDIEAALASLPPTLPSTYKAILERIENQGETSKQIAKSALRWLLCAKRPLTYPEFAAAVAPRGGLRHGVALEKPAVHTILASCCNLVAVETVSGQALFRLLHSTVREFLEPLEEYNDATNQFQVGKRCLQTYCLWGPNFRHDALLSYSTKYWPAHVEPVQADLAGLLKVLLKDEEHLYDWLEMLEELLNKEKVGWSNKYETQLDACLSPTPSPLFPICCFGLTEAFKRPDIRSTFVDLEQKNKNGTSALFLAARWGHAEIAHELLESGVDVNGKGRTGTALTAAAFAGHYDIVKMLLLKKKRVRNSGNASQAALVQDHDDAFRAALRNVHKEIAKILLDDGFEFDNQHSFDKALRMARFSGQVYTVMELLDGRAGKFAVEAPLQPDPLQVALYGGKTREVRSLLQSYANMSAEINEQRGHFGNPLAAAIASGRLDLVKQIVKAGARIEERGRFGFPLRAAAVADKGHRVDIVRYLLEEVKADPNQQDEELGDALQAAASRGDCHVMLLLLSHGADVDGGPGGSFGNTMEAAAYGGHAQAVRLLLEHNASFRDALSVAVVAGQQHIVTLLLDKGAKEILNCHAASASQGPYTVAYAAAPSYGPDSY